MINSVLRRQRVFFQKSAPFFVLDEFAFGNSASSMHLPISSLFLIYFYISRHRSFFVIYSDSDASEGGFRPCHQVTILPGPVHR